METLIHSLISVDGHKFSICINLSTLKHQPYLKAVLFLDVAMEYHTELNTSERKALLK